MKKRTIRTSIPGFSIRFATEQDTTLILRFIGKLAEYEKLSGEVIATERDLKKHLFGEQPHAEVILGEYQEKPVGFALFFHNFSTFLGKPGLYLEDLFVEESERGKGYGKCLLSFLARVAVQRDCGRLEWWVLDWNKPAIDFYESIGAIPMDEWTTYRLTGPSLKQLAKEF